MDTPIEIPTAGNTHEVARWIWRNLVPKSGQCSTVQGELLRTVEKLSWEAHNNGNGNWDSGFDILLDFLERTLCSEPGIGDEMKGAIREDVGVLRNYEYPCFDESVYDRLTAAVVAYCRIHPRLIEKPPNPLLHR
jgi:hypothetical protein